MTVTHAQSLVPDLTVVEVKPEEDEAALDRLGLWCVMYSPLVTPDPPDGVFIDVAGSTHLFHGEIALMEDLCKRLKQAGISGRAAISDTPGCSWAVARYGENMHVPPGRASEAIASLRKLLASYKGRRFLVPEFKSWTNISRKYAIPLLEYLDRQHVTRREGDARVVL